MQLDPLKPYPNPINSNPSFYLKMASVASSLGVIVIVQSQKGLRAVLIGDTLPLILRDLNRHFLNAKIIHDPRTMKKKIDLICRHIEKPKDTLDLPLDLCGSSFQLRVWNEIKLIPSGRTASYKEIATRIGNPKAIRAVASACSSNMHALAIPCHRVIGNDGKLCGYRWGISRKMILLEREKKCN